MKIYEAANKEQRVILERSIAAFAGSMNAFKELDWCCVR